jgi:outer membrane protein assembly factor BamB
MRADDAGADLVRALVRLAVLGVLLAVVAAAAGARGAGDRLTWGYDAARTSFDPAESAIGVGTVGSLVERWSFDLGAVSNTAPTVVSNVLIGSRRRTLVLAGSEHGRLVALDARTGGLVWERDLGSQATDCGDMPGGVFGVTAPPAVDRAGGRLYAAGGDGRLYALDLASGDTLAGWPVRATRRPDREHVYGGLTLVAGRVYATLASYCDIAPYHGSVAAYDAASGPRLAAFYPVGRRGFVGGGIWGPGGVSVDEADGSVYTATGNALAIPETVRYAEHLVRLDAELHVQAADMPPLSGTDVDSARRRCSSSPPAARRSSRSRARRAR